MTRQKHGSSTTENLDEAHVRMALDKLRIMDVLKGKSGIGGKNRKEMGEHKFWSTQPVPQLGNTFLLVACALLITLVLQVKEPHNKMALLKPRNR